MILGLASFSQGSEDLPEFHDAEYTSLEDYDEFIGAEEEESDEEEDEASQEESPEISQDEFQDASSEGSDPDLQEDTQDAFKEILREALKTWNADVRACDTDVACLARVNNVLRPIVNEAADNGVLSVIDPCEDRVGTYEVETVDGWTIEATLPC